MPSPIVVNEIDVVNVFANLEVELRAVIRRQLRGTVNREEGARLAEEIVLRCAEVEPRLGDARVLEHRVGLRPARATVRVEAEPLGASTCVHNYGHGGTGVGLSWGSAREVAALLGS